MRPRHHISRLLSATLPALALCYGGACGGAGFDKGVVNAQGLKFRTGMPPAAWQLLATSTEGASVQWRHRDDASGLQVDGRCGTRFDAPLKRIERQLLMGFDAVELAASQPRHLHGRDALQSDFRARIDGVTRYFRIVTFKREGCSFDYVLTTSNSALQKTHAPTLEALVQAFVLHAHPPLREPAR